MNVKVEYEDTPIRHIAVQCPKCKRWYNGRAITYKCLSYDSDIYRAQFICPVCGHAFGATAIRGVSNLKIIECESADEVYEGCLKRREVWE